MQSQEESARIASLESRYSHLDNRVSSIAEDMSAIKATLATLVHGVEDITDRVNAPSQVNLIAIGSFVVALVLAFSQYIDLRLTPINDKVVENYEEIRNHTAIQIQRSKELGTAQAQLQQLQKELDRLNQAYIDRE